MYRVPRTPPPSPSMASGLTQGRGQSSYSARSAPSPLPVSASPPRFLTQWPLGFLHTRHARLRVLSELPRYALLASPPTGPSPPVSLPPRAALHHALSSQCQYLSSAGWEGGVLDAPGTGWVAGSWLPSLYSLGLLSGLKTPWRLGALAFTPRTPHSEERFLPASLKAWLSGP